LNDDKVISAATDNILSLDIDVREIPSICLSGVDTGSAGITWLCKNVKKGDKISVEVVDVREVSEHMEREPPDMIRLLQQYEALKKELEEDKLL